MSAQNTHTYFNIPTNSKKMFSIYLVTLGIQEYPLSFKGDDIIENNEY